MKASPWILIGTLLATTFGASGGPPRSQAAQTPSPGDQARRGEDEKAIRGAVDAFVQTFTKGDAPVIAAMFTEQGEAIDISGGAIRGRAALQAHYAERFAAEPGEKLETRIELIHFLAPEVARQDGHSKLIPANGGLPSTSRYTATFVKTQGRWLIASIRDLEDSTITPHERLKELEWLIGDWVEETGEAVIKTSIAWSEDKNFLLRSFDIHVAGKSEIKGTQRIGWDPLTRQIKSWVFDSRGGFGDGYWTRSGEQWIIKSSGVQPGGLTTSATQTLTRVNKERMLWKSTDRTLGGETRNDIDEFVMVRKPPEPK